VMMMMMMMMMMMLMVMAAVANDDHGTRHAPARCKFTAETSHPMKRY